MEASGVILLISGIGGTLGIISTLTAYFKGGFRKDFDSEKALEDIKQLKLGLKEVEVQLEEEVKMLNLHIMKQTTETRTSNAEVISGLRSEVGSMNKHIIEMTEKLGILTGLIEGQNRRRDG